MSVRAAVGLLGELAERQAKPGGAAFHLNEPEVYALWAALGLRHGAFAYVAADGDLAAWAAGATRLADGEGRLVLKLVGRDILHKTEAGGVRICKLASGSEADQLAAQGRDLLAGAQSRGVHGVEGLLAAAFVPHVANRPGQEALLTLRQDPAFGPCVVVGVGGTLTEWHGASGTRRCGGGPDDGGCRGGFAGASAAVAACAAFAAVRGTADRGDRIGGSGRGARGPGRSGRAGQ